MSELRIEFDSQHNEVGRGRPVLVRCDAHPVKRADRQTGKLRALLATLRASARSLQGQGLDRRYAIGKGQPIGLYVELPNSLERMR